MKGDVHAVLDRERLEAVLEAAEARLKGEWLLVGGALVCLWLEPRRVTEDVDLIGLSGTAEERLALMTLADDLGLPVEAVNSAADYFVRRIDGWREELEVFRAAGGFTLYRPSPTLFLLLKIGRLTEADLGDCLAVIRRARVEGLRIDAGRVRAALDALPPAADDILAERRTVVRAALD